ncbi:MAG: NAD(P)-dependent oxidoreductase [Nitrospirae bacterium]|nr:NAD(P)-dependent oxidoreductase [Nitrospirota bacterium]
MKHNILVTGSEGFIGKRLTARLVSEGYEVCAFNRSCGDISSKDNLPFKNIAHVLHLAAKTFVPASWQNPYSFYNTNVMGTANVLEFCRKNGCSLTFVSSYIYGTPKELPVSEKHPVNPGTPYSHSKYMAEELCRFYADNFKVKVTILRPFNIYGPAQNDSFLIPAIIKQALDSSTDTIEVMDLLPRRDFLYVEDFVDALMLTIQDDNYALYNVGAGYSLSVSDVIQTVLDVLNTDKKVISKDVVRENEINDVIADITKIRNELNWQPKHSFNEGIIEIIRSTCLRK